MNKRVLLTGIGGFVGSHVLQYLIENTDWEILGIDSFRHKGTFSRIDEVFKRIGDSKNRVKIFTHDLSVPIDNVLENKLVNKQLDGSCQTIDYIINIASDSAVERSIHNPVACLKNNFDIVINMLEFAKKLKDLSVFLQFSTDEIAGDATNVLKGHKEWATVLPSNPYAASKAAQEAVAISYWRSYNLPIIITNAMNIIGEWQDTEKFLPRLIWKLATKQKMQIYADDEGNIGSRFYIHGKNIGSAIVFLLDKSPSLYPVSDRPDRYNLVGDIELDNLEVAQLVSSHLGLNLDYEIVTSKSVRPGYDKRYALDGSKMTELGWKPPICSIDSIKEVADWTYNHPWWIL